MLGTSEGGECDVMGVVKRLDVSGLGRHPPCPAPSAQLPGRLPGRDACLPACLPARLPACLPQALAWPGGGAWPAEGLAAAWDDHPHAPLPHLPHHQLWAIDMLFVVGGQNELSSAGVIQVGGRRRQACARGGDGRAGGGWAPSSSPRRRRRRRRRRRHAHCLAPVLPLPPKQGMCDQLSVPCSVVVVPKSIDNDVLLVRGGWAGWVVCPA